MYREIVTPVSSDFILHLPDDLVGKQIEIIATELNLERKLPKSTLTKEQFLEMFGILKDSKMTIEDIRSKAWRKYSW
jgi:hypothetical protein